MTNSDIRRGQVWLVDWSPGRGSNQLGRRPALIIQTNAANTNPRYPNTIVLTVSTKGLVVATHVEIAPDARNGLRHTSWVKCEQNLTVPNDRLITLWGTLSAGDLDRVEIAVKTALALA